MQNRLELQMAQEETVAELVKKLNQAGFDANCWFDPDGMLHVAVRSKATAADREKLREFWRQFFETNMEDLDNLA